MDDLKKVREMHECAKEIDRPGPGRIVHYVIAEGPNAGQHRAAMIISAWDFCPCNLILFRDQIGDEPGGVTPAVLPMHRMECVRHDEARYQPGTWHWPEHLRTSASSVEP